jgi:hypothetical protein
MRQEGKQPDFRVHLTSRTFDPSGEQVVDPSDELKHYIVQFKKSLTHNEREYLRHKYNLSLKNYIPNFAFLERLDSSSLAALSKDPLHRASALYQPNDKISPDIGQYEPLSTERLRLNGVMIRVLLFPHVGEGDFSQLVNAIDHLRKQFTPREKDRYEIETRKRPGKDGKAEDGTEIEFDPNEIRLLDDLKLGGQLQLVFLLPSLDLLPLIAKFDEVQWIEEVVEADPDNANMVVDPGINTVAGTIQSGYPAMTPVWDKNIHGEGQRIGIIDRTYVDVDHCMFRDASGIGIGPSHRKMIGSRRYWNVGNNDHGTSVAGIAAGDEFNNSGNNPHRGIAWNAKLSYDDQKRVGYQQITLLHLLQNQFEEQVMIHSNSWHDHTEAYNKTAYNADSFVWLNEDHFVCGSTANSGNEKLGPPGTAKNVLCVSASRGYPDHLQHGDGKPGPTRDNRRKPEICAPGAGIRAADAGTGCINTPILNAATSFATPVIAGAAALVRQYYLSGFHNAGVQDLSNTLSPSAALIKATLLNSTVPMVDVDDYPNNRTGWGLVKLDNTLYLVGSPRKLFVEDVRNSDGLYTEQSRAHQVTVEDYAQLLKITLVWTDPPAKLYATGKTLINNLNLVVTSPDGNTYLGNVNFNQGFSQPVPPDTARDDLNNVEMVVVENPAPGLWTITVEAEAVNLEKQGYALVITGSLN